MRSVKEDEFLDTVRPIRLLQLCRNLESNASTIGVSNDSVWTLRLDSFHFLDIS
jgi:hypothetical protein